MDVKLVMFKRDGQRKDFPLQGGNTVVGRGEECTLRIPVPAVSRRHCELIQTAAGVRVRDLASSNGTFVNNRRVNDSPLKAGDRLTIGPIVFTLQINGQPATLTAASQPKPAGKAAKAAQALPPGLDDGEIIELEPDATAASPTDDLDPIAALEALALESKKKPAKH